MEEENNKFDEINDYNLDKKEEVKEEKKSKKKIKIKDLSNEEIAVKMKEKIRQFPKLDKIQTRIQIDYMCKLSTKEGKVNNDVKKELDRIKNQVKKGD